MDKVTFYGYSFIGKRSSNQDRFCTYKINDDAFFFAVADGMGGSKGGEIASQIIIETSQEYLKQRFLHEVQADDLKNILKTLFKACHNVLREKLEDFPELTGMGTTLTCLLFYKNKFVFGNIGDSRLYLIRNGKISQLTKDHSFIQEYIDKFGNDVPQHIQKQGNLITKALDGRGDEPDIFPLTLKYELCNEGDAYLLCSDGLIINKAEDLNGKSILNKLKEPNSLELSCKNLIHQAYNSGSTDNITLVTIRYGSLKNGKLPIKEKKKLIPDFDHPKDARKNIFDSINGKVVKYLGILSVLLILTGGIFLFKSQVNQKPEKKDIKARNEIKTKKSQSSVLIQTPGFETASQDRPLTINDAIQWDPAINYPELVNNFVLILYKNEKDVSRILKSKDIHTFRLKEFLNGKIKFSSGEKVTIQLKIEATKGFKTRITKNDKITLTIK